MTDLARQKRRSDAFFVLGNGPSLRELALPELGTLDSIGMNAAYRHWEKIQWYPRYYCCMDLVVLESHRREVYDLIQRQQELGIQRFFLRDCILEFYPDLADHPAVYILDRHRDTSRFLRSEPITTGNYSALFGVLMGYRRIVLLGVDCNYVERVGEASAVEGIVLEMNRTPTENPNYFFADYQQVGDRFNVPNPQRGMHRRSWLAVYDAARECGVTVENCGSSSKLDVFPFTPLADVLSREEAG